MKDVHDVIADLDIPQINSRYVFERGNNKLGTGSYGSVYRAFDKFTSNYVAIKFINKITRDYDAKDVLREISILHILKGENNILRLLDVLTSKEDGVYKGIALVFEQHHTNLERVILSNQEIRDNQIQCIMHQLLNAVTYMHSANIMHRDLKPSNILINSDCSIVLCDFSISRSIKTVQLSSSEEFPISSNELTSYVITRWYRAPEIILDNSEYGTMADIWSVGCILAELFYRSHFL